MPRLFTGIEIPASLQLRLALIGAPLAGARWIKPQNMHITLCFAGDIDNLRADDWAAQLAKIEMPAFDVTIAGLDTFGGRRPRCIWAGIENGEALQRLHLAHLRAARAVGIACDNRRYRPHVTLARLRGGSHAGSVASYLSANAAIRFGSFTATRLVLFSARPGQGGGPYAVEDSYPLQQHWQAHNHDNNHDNNNGNDYDSQP